MTQLRRGLRFSTLQYQARNVHVVVEAHRGKNTSDS